MDAERAQDAFANYLKGKGLKEADLSLSSFLPIFLDYYRAIEFPELERSTDGDVLLFQYGIFDWGEGPFFEVDFTRQFYECFPADDEFEIDQHRFTFYFEPEDFTGIKDFNTWSHDHEDLDAFSEVIKASPGYREAVPRTPVKVLTSIERV